MGSLPALRGFDHGEEWVGDSRIDQRAFYGLGACPCAEATEALFRVYDHFVNEPEIRDVVADELLRRMPRHGRATSWFVEQAWEPRFEPLALARARAALRGSSQVPGWTASYQWGANLVVELGDATDAMLLTRAMERALEGTPDEGGDARSFVVQTLDWALRLNPGPVGNASGDAKLVLDMRGWDGLTGEPPPGWEAVVMPALESHDPVVVAEAVRKLPRPASPALVDALVPHVGSADLLVSSYLHGYLTRHPPGDIIREPLLAELATAEPSRVEPLLAELRPYVPLRDWVNVVLVKLSADPSNRELLDLLTNFGLDVKACKERSGGRLSSDEVPTIVRAWMLALRTSDLRAPLPIVAGETNPALVSPSFSCKLATTGKTWPAR